MWFRFIRWVLLFTAGLGLFLSLSYNTVRGGKLAEPVTVSVSGLSEEEALDVHVYQFNASGIRNEIPLFRTCSGYRR